MRIYGQRPRLRSQTISESGTTENMKASQVHKLENEGKRRERDLGIYGEMVAQVESMLLPHITNTVLISPH